MKNDKGFTLIELLLTIALIAIVGVISGVIVMNSFSDSKSNLETIQEKNIIEMVKVYFNDNLNYYTSKTPPTACTDNGNTRKCIINTNLLVSNEYIEQPVDIKTKKDIMYSIAISFTLDNNKVSNIGYSIANKIIQSESSNTIVATNLKPINDSKIKTGGANEVFFSVENYGMSHKKITIDLVNIEIDEELGNKNFRWGLFNADTDNGLSFGIFKDVTNGDSVNIMRDVIIDSMEKPKNYILRVWIHDDGTGQSSMLNKKFSADIAVSMEDVEYTPESCFTFDNGTISQYDESCGTDLVIPKTIDGETVTTISQLDLYGEPLFAENLTSVIIPNTITQILGQDSAGEYTPVFSGTFKSITIPESVNKIFNAVESSSLSTVFIPETLTLHEFAFNGSFNSIIINNDILMEYWDTTFEFANSSNLTNLIFMDGVTKIQVVIGASNKLESIEIPSSVEIVVSYVFDSCPNLKEIIVRGKDSLDDFEDASGLEDYEDIIVFR